MESIITRRSFVAGAGALTLGLLTACGTGAGSGAGASTTGGGAGSSAAGAGRIFIGTLATEDILPYWVAADEGLFAAAGLDVEVVVFQSATELIAGVASGEVDLAMTDIMVAASMFASDIDVRLGWVTLGADATQGRFGIMVGPGSDVRSLGDLAGVPIGVGSNTILEYVMDRLMEDAGVAPDQIVVEELQKLPVRYQAMASGEVAAAALPASLLALGEANGCSLVADDTGGENLSQSVMAISSTFIEDSPEVAEKLEAVWDEAVEKINADPEAYRAVLVANANLSEVVADSYPISTYPACALPTGEMVHPVLDWMEQKGYLTRQLSYDDTKGTFASR